MIVERLRAHAAWAAAIASVAIIWFVWGEWNPLPAVHDEVAYLLQADIFARLRWTAPPPPIPDFFEQPYVLVSPVLASKYPPGHSMLLVPGALLGFHALVPLLLTGLTAWLLVTLATRVAGLGTALVTWAVWITAPLVLRFQPSYFSELSTQTLMLSSWLFLLRWRESGRRQWLLLVAAAIGAGAITRPLTMLALAIPVGVVVVRDVARSRRWRDLGMAMALGTAILLVLPLWSQRTTGDWRLTPLELYTRTYIPFDRMGFRPDTTPPVARLTPVMQQTADYILAAHREHTVARLPRIAWERAVAIATGMFQGWRLPLLALALVGLIAASAPVWFAVASAAALVVAYLGFAYYAGWTLYYLETAPVAAFLAALGLARAARALRVNPGRVALVVAALVLLAGVREFARWREHHLRQTAFDRLFLAQLAQLPTRPAIVFVRYSPRFVQHLAVVRNHPDLARAPVWVVHDLGPRNDELRRLAPERASFDFDEDQLAGAR